MQERDHANERYIRVDTSKIICLSIYAVVFGRQEDITVSAE